MSTRCRIGYVREDGSIESIYCHHDGYQEKPGVGYVLKTYYNDIEDVKKLMSLGDISSLGNKPVNNPYAWNHPKFDALHETYEDWYNRFHKEDLCETYADRGDDEPSIVNKNVEEYMKLTIDCWGEYCYLFKNDKWEELIHVTEN